MLVVASSRIASSRGRHLVVICFGMFGQDKLLPLVTNLNEKNKIQFYHVKEGCYAAWTNVAPSCVVAW
jgi:hypothetical protein